MLPSELIAGFLLAAFATRDASHGASAATSAELAAAVEARRAQLGLSPDASHEIRERALHALARAAASDPLAVLPTAPRVASLLAPIASPGARAGAVALPLPRRGYRVPPGLREQLRRLADPTLRARRAAEEVARLSERAWPA